MVHGTYHPSFTWEEFVHNITSTNLGILIALGKNLGILIALGIVSLNLIIYSNLLL